MHYTSATLAKMLIKRGILHPWDNRKAFMRACEKYLKHHGQRPVPSCTGTCFFLTLIYAEEREKCV